MRTHINKYKQMQTKQPHIKTHSHTHTKGYLVFERLQSWEDVIWEDNNDDDDDSHSRSTPTRNRVREVSHQLFEALAHVHVADLAHCDVKPGNIMFGADGGLRLIDFDRARSRDARTFGNHLCTLNTCAPELLGLDGGNVRFDGWALDAWSAGVVLADLAVGDHIFHGGDGERGMILQIDELLLSFKVLGASEAGDYYFESFSDAHSKMLDVLGKVGLDLLSRLLQPDPAVRLNVAGALDHPFFKS